MGMDLFGNARDAEGEELYFRNNVWWWRETWHCACDNGEGILTDEDMQAGMFNDCHPISKAKALRLGRLLLDRISDGTITNDSYGEKMNGFDYPFTTENLKEFAEFCIRSNGFRIC